VIVHQITESVYTFEHKRYDAEEQHSLEEALGGETVWEHVAVHMFTAVENRYADVVGAAGLNTYAASTKAGRVHEKKGRLGRGLGWGAGVKGGRGANNGSVRRMRNKLTHRIGMKQ